MEQKDYDRAFNDLSGLVRVADSRMEKLDQDATWERAQIKYENLKFMRNGTDAKFDIEYDGKIHRFRPLSIKEDSTIEMEALELFHKLPEYKRTARQLDYLTVTRILSHAMSPCPEQPEPLRIQEIEAMPGTYVMGLYKKYVALCEQLNPDVDTISNEHIEELIEELRDSPKLVNNCTQLELKAICLELLRINTILAGS